MNAHLKFLADEDFKNTYVRGLRRHHPEIEIIRVQDVGLRSSKDPEILTWAANHERVVLTHDANTMPRHAEDRTRRGDRMPGVFVVVGQPPVKNIIDDINCLAHCSLPNEWEGRVGYLPLK